MFKRFIKDDNGAFTLEEMIESVLTFGIGIILIAILIPIAFEMFGGLPTNVAVNPATGEPTMVATIWGYIPTIVVIMILIGVIYAVLGWLGGKEGEKR
jgi:ABC-type antimicrobial peptide transport system permease subunit